ncbi:hypothetical protein SAMN02745823_01788 [Sporobacter termitidis DSM 10068]|uniref:Mannosylglycerate hydrolase MGH1-like glycoside hydrolase domain-containing protein n=1 Tax=Sporobacter termitidis DSM 10068 TaxID=1123282 RepID=A0A1M5XGY9_9FIRM|nr:hypothetical protein [Sporobacter termitidis]SHH98774.1 hypothetical protein SAMN02745823_01788 [Sporobacter termitidis DSM 10068]
MFGTNEKFNLQRAVFARSASAFFIFEDYYSHLLRLTNYKPASIVLTSPFLFNLRLFSGGAELPYTYFSDAGVLRMDSEKGSAEFVLTDREQLRVRGAGVALRVELCPAIEDMGTIACHGVRRKPDGAVEAVFGTYGKFLFKALKGRVEAICPWNEETGGYDAVIFDILPGEGGTFEAAVHEDMEELVIGDEAYPPFDALIRESLDSFEAFKQNYRPAAEGYEELRDYAAYQIWSHRAKAGGGFKEPGILFQCSIAGIFSWQQSYHGMTMLNNPQEAWRQICTLFLYQDERTGRLPSFISYLGGSNPGIQPPFQGFALDVLIRRAGDSFLTPAECERMYPRFAKWAEYWLMYRNAGRGGDVTAVNNPNDSGWDDASIFKDGFPAQNPDIIAFVIVLMEMTARLARGCGKAAQADSWKARSDRLLDTLVREFWDGEKFATFVGGKPVDSMSLACYQPILLGDRLPRHIIDKVARRLTEEGDFLCEIGLCTESLKSPLCDYGANTFVSGRVVAPPHLILTVGLDIAGKKKEAALIARRWCDTVKERGVILGFAPYEYYRLTGEKADITQGPVASDGWSWSTWSACCTMTMITSVIPEEEG